MNLTDSSTVIDQGGPVGSLREALIGAWQLVACVETDVETGEIFLPMGPHPAGFITAGLPVQRRLQSGWSDTSAWRVAAHRSSGRTPTLPRIASASAIRRQCADRGEQHV
jgi:hypothetical protein